MTTALAPGATKPLSSSICSYLRPPPEHEDIARLVLKVARRVMAFFEKHFASGGNWLLQVLEELQLAVVLCRGQRQRGSGQAEVCENLLQHRRVGEGGDDGHPPEALVAEEDVDGEDAVQELGPGEALTWWKTATGRERVSWAHTAGDDRCWRRGRGRGR
jgi:hypothetical protein